MKYQDDEFKKLRESDIQRLAGKLFTLQMGTMVWSATRTDDQIWVMDKAFQIATLFIDNCNTRSKGLSDSLTLDKG